MKKSKNIILKHVFLFIISAFIICFSICPSKIILGIPCPGCRLSRAYICAAKLDFATAIKLHPLFPVAMPSLLYLIHYRCLPHRLPKTAEYILGFIILVAFIAVYGYRMITDEAFRNEGWQPIIKQLIK